MFRKLTIPVLLASLLTISLVGVTSTTVRADDSSSTMSLSDLGKQKNQLIDNLIKANDAAETARKDAVKAFEELKQVLDSSTSTGDEIIEATTKVIKAEAVAFGAEQAVANISMQINDTDNQIIKQLITLLSPST